MTSGSQRSSDKCFFLKVRVTGRDAPKRVCRHVLDLAHAHCVPSRRGDPPTRTHSWIRFAAERSIPNAWSRSPAGCHRKPAPWGHSFSVFPLFCLKSRRQRPLPWRATMGTGSSDPRRSSGGRAGVLGPPHFLRHLPALCLGLAAHSPISCELPHQPCERLMDGESAVLTPCYGGS